MTDPLDGYRKAYANGKRIAAENPDMSTGQKVLKSVGEGFVIGFVAVAKAIGNMILASLRR